MTWHSVVFLTHTPGQVAGRSALHDGLAMSTTTLARSHTYIHTNTHAHRHTRMHECTKPHTHTMLEQTDCCCRSLSWKLPLHLPRGQQAKAGHGSMQITSSLLHTKVGRQACNDGHSLGEYRCSQLSTPSISYSLQWKLEGQSADAVFLVDNNCSWQDQCNATLPKTHGCRNTFAPMLSLQHLATCHHPPAGDTPPSPKPCPSSHQPSYPTFPPSPLPPALNLRSMQLWKQHHGDIATFCGTLMLHDERPDPQDPSYPIQPVSADELQALEPALNPQLFKTAEHARIFPLEGWCDPAEATRAFLGDAERQGAEVLFGRKVRWGHTVAKGVVWLRKRCMGLGA